MDAKSLICLILSGCLWFVKTFQCCELSSVCLIAYTIILLNHIEQQHLLYWPVIKVSHCVITSFFLYSSGAVVRKQELVFYPRGNLDSLCPHFLSLAPTHNSCCLFACKIFKLQWLYLESLSLLSLVILCDSVKQVFFPPTSLQC